MRLTAARSRGRKRGEKEKKPVARSEESDATKAGSLVISVFLAALFISVRRIELFLSRSLVFPRFRISVKVLASFGVSLRAFAFFFVFFLQENVFADCSCGGFPPRFLF
jgi:hypothetical protein